VAVIVLVRVEAAALNHLGIDLREGGKLDPVVDSAFALSDVRAAHQRMDQRQRFGKIVLRVS
jgi:hypothetical protein